MLAAKKIRRRTVLHDGENRMIEFVGQSCMEDGCSKVDRKVLSASADQSSVWRWCHATDGNLRNATVCVRGNDVGEAVGKQARQAMI